MVRWIGFMTRMDERSDAIFQQFQLPGNNFYPISQVQSWSPTSRLFLKKKKTNKIKEKSCSRAIALKCN